MLETMRSIFKLLGTRKRDVQIAIVFHLIRSFFAACDLFAILYVMIHIEQLTSRTIGIAALILGIGLVGKFICQWRASVLVSTTAYDVFQDQRLTIGERLKQAPMGYFNSHRLGSIQTAVTTGLNELESNAVAVVENILGNIIYCVITTVVLCAFNLPIGLVMLAALLIDAVVLERIQRLSEGFAQKQVDSKEAMTSRVMEFVQGIMVMRLFAHKGEEMHRVKDAFAQKKAADLMVENTVSWPVNFYNFVFRVAGGIVIALAVFQCYQGKLSFSLCMMFLLSAFLINAQAGAIGGNIALLKAVSVALSHFEKVLEMPDMQGDEVLVPADGYDLKLEHVDFGYTDRKVIDDVSMDIPFGSSVAIVGPSGSGKTTLCNLMARFFDVDGGRITLGGKDLRSLQPDAVLSQMSFVFQNVYLFEDTVEHNVKFGRADATHEEVVEACKKACCHDFIMALPNGYDTVLSEGGASLSGGERQRISIARAMLKDAKIIILDEATSSVDPENEYLLVQALENLSANKTLISIAHRLSTVSKADQIVVMEQGRVVERGTHAELMQEDGLYKRFITIRSQAMQWELGRA